MLPRLTFAFITLWAVLLILWTPHASNDRRQQRSDGEGFSNSLTINTHAVSYGGKGQ